MKHSVKRVAAIHDLSGFGRASLTAIIPILSSMGVQVCPLPTAILSNHTGGFDTFSFVDFTDHMQDYIDHWKELNIDFDCIFKLLCCISSIHKFHANAGNSWSISGDQQECKDIMGCIDLV